MRKPRIASISGLLAVGAILLPLLVGAGPVAAASSRTAQLSRTQLTEVRGTVARGIATGITSDATAGELEGVSCSSAKACTAVGNAGRSTLAAAWNGDKWTIEHTPKPTGSSSNSLTGVSCTSTTACTAVGDYVNSARTVETMAESWNGKKWAIEHTPNPAGSPDSTLDAVSCISARSCTAVGNYATSYYFYETLIEDWNGKKWTIEPSPNPAGAGEGSFLSGVSCTSDTWCVSVGSYAVVNNGVPRTLAESWNGKKWTIEPTLTTAEWSLSAVSCSSATACTAGGSRPTGTLAESWNGKKWMVVSSANPIGAKDSSLSGMSCTSVKACTAVGGSSAGILAESWNGKKWTMERAENPTGTKASYLSGVSCPSVAACAAVGYYGTVTSTALTEVWNGKKWTIEPTP